MHMIRIIWVGFFFVALLTLTVVGVLQGDFQETWYNGSNL
ncbi:hypothetical protein conserved in magnetotactic Delta [Desulfovibrionales bacterium]